MFQMLILAYIASGLDRDILETYVSFVIVYPCDIIPKMIPPSIRDADSLYKWAALDEKEFLVIAKEIVHKQHDAFLRSPAFEHRMKLNIMEMKEQGIGEDQLVMTVTKRVYYALQNLERSAIEC